MSALVSRVAYISWLLSSFTIRAFLICSLQFRLSCVPWRRSMKRTCSQATQGHAEAEMARDLAQQQVSSLTSKLHELQLQFAEVQQQRQRLQEQLGQQQDKQKHQEHEQS